MSDEPVQPPDHPAYRNLRCPSPPPSAAAQRFQRDFLNGELTQRGGRLAVAPISIVTDAAECETVVAIQ
jgi:hypothetical protein